MGLDVDGGDSVCTWAPLPRTGAGRSSFWENAEPEAGRGCMNHSGKVTKNVNARVPAARL
jgi:hypothetical protein